MHNECWINETITHHWGLHLPSLIKHPSSNIIYHYASLRLSDTSTTFSAKIVDVFFSRFEEHLTPPRPLELVRVIVLTCHICLTAMYLSHCTCKS